MGQFGRIRKEPSGFPHCEWIDDIPNEGLIYYTSAFNAERIFVTSPKALAEVLTQKSYTFIKPRQIAQSVGQFLGLGTYVTGLKFDLSTARNSLGCHCTPVR